ncbi:electron transporter SenC [Pseudomonas taeanensis MS-3]|uniref:Electron transporter SenC n=1 Tax=Pseudomonas taeanensis MS-3 TaxID=1395571 RepID=A0A0A1YGP5_9PSED|nr:SCO family protein [Pseudomonas taeanensis]KFX69065.1 electron transporter SenC [Pseudomonas taeanensis MS-3]
MNTRRKLLAGIGTAALGGLLWGRTSLQAHEAFESAAIDMADASVDGAQNSYFPNVWLDSHEGKRVRFYDDLVRGKIAVINFMFVQCGDICPTMTANLIKVQKLLGERMGRDIFMYSISLQPLMDTPEVLKAYAEMHRVQPGWQFLTGTEADIKRLRYGLGFYDPEPEVDRNLGTHTGMLRIGNDRSERWTMAPALAEPERILATINHVDSTMVHTAYRPVAAASGLG